ncbi:murein hydrolase activator EnvC family protein [Caulobacter sp. NIBR2454]|uniref:murein hydrolase activator EnvC family protein n=1 Tax=Caulobacter sp. NIBR2454 TaxID=3015996 RepID=UPI0022B6FBD6|nr:peptidoglycan DD-metalloendopeptidase family protein [Caulobacter sp. NIBR2454]
MARRFVTVAVILAALAAAGGVAAVQIDQRTANTAAALQARRDIAALRSELDRLQSEQTQDLTGVEAKRAALQSLNVREAALTVELGKNRASLAKLLSMLQMFRRDPPPALLVSPDDARDAVRAAILVQAMTPTLRARADEVASRARVIATLRREAAASAEDLFTTESALADRRGLIERRLTEAAELERQVALAGLTPPPRAAGPLSLIRPVEGTIIRKFGEALPNGGHARGLSMAAGAGETVKSPARAVVEYAGPLEGWGLVLILRAEGAYHLVLAGLGGVSVVPGQSVAAGAPVGRTTDGGKSEAELYFEVREGETPVDPAKRLKPTA